MMAADERVFLRQCIEYQARIDGLLAWMQCDPRIHVEWVALWQRATMLVQARRSLDGIRRAQRVSHSAHRPRIAGRPLENSTCTPSTNSRRSRQRGQKTCTTSGSNGERTGAVR